MKKVVLILITIVIIIGLIAFFYPKNAGGGTCGFCPPDMYKWKERNCLGFTYFSKACEGAFDKLLGIGTYCTDSGGGLLCYGIVYGSEKCYDRYEEPRKLIFCD